MSDQRQFAVLRYLRFHREAYGTPAGLESISACVKMEESDTLSLLKHMEDSGAVFYRRLRFAGSGWYAAEDDA